MIVVDAAHGADTIVAAVDDRWLTAIVRTHAHNEHIDAAPALSARTEACLLPHLDDRLL